MKTYKLGLLTLLFLTFVSGIFPVDVSANEGTVTIAGTLSPTETTETASSSSSSEEVQQISSTMYEVAIDSQKTDNLPQLGDYSLSSLICLICGISLLAIALYVLYRKRKHTYTGY